jgi:phage shock protein PspC (stress-responsive transcriptional regulator)
MITPTIDLTAIFWGAVIEFIVDTAIFLKFRIKNTTLIINFFLSFIIPYLIIWAFINSKPPVEQAIPVLGNYLVTSIVNLLIFVLSAGISYIIGSIVYQASGGRTEEPEF